MDRIGRPAWLGEFQDCCRFANESDIILHATHPQNDRVLMEISVPQCCYRNDFELPTDEVQPVFVPIERSICE